MTWRQRGGFSFPFSPLPVKYTFGEGQTHETEGWGSVCGHPEGTLTQIPSLLMHCICPHGDLQSEASVGVLHPSLWCRRGVGPRLWPAAPKLSEGFLDSKLDLCFFPPVLIRIESRLKGHVVG